ncbi:MAG: 23S rRNA (pseudouridine(1915)-N(3))-methyltransferase RlmH, partial [Clostridia bacterium]|nr:23S rRNA (pseudouridine(1915)-N(3))-methyltransferase RlmH [Clostridia bacterium]
MIKLNIVAVGKLKEKFWTDAINEYVKRISKYATLSVIECPEGVDEGNAERLQKQEESGILKKIKGYCVLLAIDGDLIKSEDLANLIERESTKGNSEFTFVIGGSRGVSDEVRKRADKLIS